MIKNVAGKAAVFAWDSGAGAPKTGDAANITGQISLDGGVSASTNDVHPTELDAVNHKGIYIFDYLAAEANADMVILSPTSTTAGVVFKPFIAYPTTLTPTKSGYLDATVSSRSTATQGATAGELTAAQGAIIAALPDVDGLALEDGGRLEVIQERTDRLPDVPAAQGDIPAAVDLAPLIALVTRALGLAGENLVMDQTVFDADKKLTSARVRIYDSAAHALAAGDTGVIGTFPLTLTWATKLLETMTQVKA